MTSTPFLSLDGAVPAEGVDAGVAGHYGNPIVEQRKLEGGDAIVDLSNRGVVTVTGPDRLSWLHSMASQALDRLAPGQPAEALFLDASGRIEHAVHAIDDGETMWLIVEGDEAEPLAAWLDRMRFMLRVEVADRTGEFVVIGATKTSALDAATPAFTSNGVPLDWADPWSTPAPGVHRYAHDAGHPASDWHWIERIVPRSALADASRSRASVPVPGRRRLSAWLAMECSHDSRSGPVTVTTPRSERSTIASPRSSLRCSTIGLP